MTDDGTDAATIKVPPGHVLRYSAYYGKFHYWTEPDPEVMARRDNFALAALSGMDTTYWREWASPSCAAMAAWAYAIADAMEAERNK